MASRGLSVEEIKTRCEKVQVTYVSHYVEKDNKGKSTTFIIGKCQCGNEIKISVQNMQSKMKQGKTCSCKECGKKKVNVKIVEETKQKFLQQLSLNGHVLLSEYVNSREKVLIDFNCEHEPHWMTPSCYINGQRCPKCWDERRSETTRQQMASMSEEEKQEFSKKIKTTFANKTDEEKEIMSRNISEGLANMSEEAKQQRLENMSAGVKEYYASMSEEEKQAWRNKLSESSPRLSGEQHPNWRSDLTDEDRQTRMYFPGYSKWSKDVKEKANYACDCCGTHDEILHSHHLNDFHSHKELATDISNGVCLCEHCHKEFHSYMGGYHAQCTADDYYEWKQAKNNNDSELDSATNVA